LKIRQIAFASPDNRVDSDIVAEWSGLKTDFVVNKIGVESRGFLMEDERPIDLAISACEKLLAGKDAPKRDAIGLVVLVTQNPDYRIPHSSALLQHALRLPASTAAFDIGLGCSGYVYALSAAKGMMQAEDIENALLVTCDPYSRIMDRTDRDTIALFGDAATATWLSREKGGVIGRTDFGTDGAGAENLIVRVGGAAKPLTGLYHQQGGAAPDRDLRLSMNGRGIFNFMMERIPSSVERTLSLNKVKPEDVDLFVFHQGSRFLLDQLAGRIGIPSEKVPVNIARHGNTVSSSIPLLLSELGQAGKLGGKKVLVSGFGVGLSWATSIIQF
jgi:3-oxoacyl-[acyl-carrier-protein] synthase III